MKMPSNKQVIESNIKGLEFTIKLKEKKKLSSKEKRSLAEQYRLLERQKKRLKTLNEVGEELYTKMYPYS